MAQLAAAALAGAGGIVGAAGDRRAGKNAKLEGKVSKKILDFNAAQVEATAKQEAIFATEQAAIEARSRIEISQIEEERVARRGEVFTASQRAAVGKSGVTIEGSPLDFLSETAGEIIEERALTLRQGLVESGRLKAQASIFSSTTLARANANAAILRQQGNQAKRLGAAANSASKLQAANRLLSAGGSAAGSFGGGAKPTQAQGLQQTPAQSRTTVQGPGQQARF